MRGVEYSGLTKTSPPFLQDWVTREHVLPVGVKLDAAQFTAEDAVVVNVGAAGAAAGAVAVPVDALSGPIPNGTILDFGADKFVKLAAAAAAGDTVLTTVAIPTALVDADTATYAGIATRAIPAGTAIGRTYAERETDTPFGPADAADDEVFLLAYDVTDVTVNNDAEVLRHGTMVLENFLPGFDTLAAGVQADIRALYTTSRGVE